MAKGAFETVDAYLAAQPEGARSVLSRVRSVIRKAVPRAEETISYNIPAYQLSGRTVIFFAGWKKHYAIYPASHGVLAKFKKELAAYEVNDKGTIRFPLTEKVPATLIGGIAKLRAREEREALAARANRLARRATARVS
jgi:uncharacterized protein YdhG (YjbR/CyaY superfamily)